MISSRPSLRCSLPLIAGGLIALAMAVPLPHNLRMTRFSGLLDLGHFFGFAVLAASAAWAWPRRIGVVVAALVVLPLLGEVGQPLVGRTADWRDFAFGALGALAGLILAWAVARSARRAVSSITWGLTAAIGLAAWPLVSCLPLVADAAWEYRAFPVLCDFRSPWEGRRWHMVGADLNRIVDPLSAGRVGQFELIPQEGCSPTAVLFPLCSNWSGYRRLCCHLVVPDSPLRLGIRVRTGRGDTKMTQTGFEGLCEPGEHQIAVDLQQVQRLSPELDLSRVHSLYLFARDLHKPRSLRVSRIYLE